MRSGLSGPSFDQRDHDGELGAVAQMGRQVEHGQTHWPHAVLRAAPRIEPVGGQRQTHVATTALEETRRTVGGTSVHLLAVAAGVLQLSHSGLAVDSTRRMQLEEGSEKRVLIEELNGFD